MQTAALPKTPSPRFEHLDLSRIAQDLQIRKVQVESVVHLLDEGNTVPFITRYRKERTGGLNEEIIRAIQARVAQQRQLADRKQTILKSIEGQGKLTDELRAAIEAAETPKRLEDLYLPYKPKKRSLATTARERGLEPLALAVWTRDPAIANLEEVLPTLVNPEKELPTPAEVLQGVQHILAELIAETADVRAVVRQVLWETGKLCTVKNPKLGEADGLDYKDYFQFSESVRHIPPHRILAINRGEKEGTLQVRLEWDAEAVQRVAHAKLPLADHPHAEFLKTVTADALARLLLPSLEREIRRELTGIAEEHAVHIFARNLRSLLLAPPLRGRRVLAIDPGFRTGCKLAALDEVGNLLDETVVFPHPPQNKKDDARRKLEELVRKHQVQVVAIGNGTACRDTEEVISELISLFERRRQGGAPEPPPVPPPVEAAAPPPPAPTAEPPVLPPEAVPALAPVGEPPPPEAVPAVAPVAEGTPVLASVSEGQAPEQGGLGTQYPVLGTQQPLEISPSPQGVPPPAETAVTPPPAPPPAPVVDLSSLPEPLSELAYVIVNEAGASHYSASSIGREEFPNYDATLRSTISIGRRLQDPLSELVKVDPQNIGVGLYQHDVSPRELKESLEGVIESCVNHVGVDLNTASVPLLRHISGLNQLTARELVEYRKQHGPFRRREQLLQVPGIGEARYVQAAGFLKIPDGDNPLDHTWIHPESYPAAAHLLSEMGYGPEALREKAKLEELREKLKALAPEEVGRRLQIGAPTVQDILEALARPGRDPREDLPPPIFKKGILKLEDQKPGMELKGTVLNVVDFGAFIDIGLKDSGLVHISQMANRYIKSPYEVTAVGDVVTVWVLSVDMERKRVSLSLIKPGTERRPPERKPLPRREGSRPPRGRRPAPAGAHGGPQPVAAPQEGVQPAAGVATAAPPRREDRRPHRGRRPAPVQTQAPPPRPRKSSRPAPRPKLSKAALEGAAPLRTFSELAAFAAHLEAKQKQPKEAPAAAAVSAEPAPPPPAPPVAEEAPPPPA